MYVCGYLVVDIYLFLFTYFYLCVYPFVLIH